MSGSEKRTLGRPLHSPGMIAPDDEDSQSSARISVFIADRHSNRCGCFAMTLAAAREARTSPRAPSRNPPFNRYMLTNCAGTAVPIELLKILAKRSICVMKKRIPELARLRAHGDIHVLVHLVRVVAQIAPEQTNWIVVAPYPTRRGGSPFPGRSCGGEPGTPDTRPS
jgi:hypothetical protein